MRRAAGWSLAVAFLALAPHAARAETVTYGGATLSYTGATATTAGDDVVLTFTDTSETCTLEIPASVRARILAVGGGGAGASPAAATAAQGGAGGGGAGGMLEITNLLSVGTYHITVGSGGAAGEAAVQSPGADGEASFVAFASGTLIHVNGGGGGGIKSNGADGGSGGGGSRTGNGGSGTEGQGSAGGVGGHYQSGAGGGGAGGAGLNTEGGNAGAGGGSGRMSDISGRAVMYAGGGGGGSRGNSAAVSVGGSGGSGGGGHGGYGSTAGRTAPTAGADGFGGGGGGGCYNLAGAAGGSGVVIVRLVEAMPAKPEAAYSLEYDGSEQTAYAGSEGVTLTDADSAVVASISATAIGVHAFTATLKPGYAWSDGTTGPVRSTLTIRHIAVERPESGYTAEYDFTEQTFFAGSEAFTIVDAHGTEVPAIAAKELGDHVFTTTLKESYMWSDGTRDPAVTTVTITPVRIPGPQASYSYVSTGAEQGEFSATAGQCVITNLATGAEVPRIAATDVGAHRFAAYVLPGYAWSDGTRDPIVSTVTIAPTGMTEVPFGAGAVYLGAGYGATNWVDGDLVVSFTNTETVGRFTLLGAAQARILAVGGGGAGASPWTAGTAQGGAGGGGAGGMLDVTNLLMSGTYAINIGKGGDAAADEAPAAGMSGSPSYIQLAGADVVRALGGGGGGFRSAGADGGSGGGGSRPGAGGAGTEGQGHSGGTGGHFRSGAGGGGAGEPGADTAASEVGAAGGAGRVSDITGESVAYAGGGGGGSRGNSSAAGVGGLGGLGGGGTGGFGSTASRTAATAGVDGLGGGGGGGCYTSPGGAGGSGIVVVRFVRMMPERPQASYAYTYNGGEQGEYAAVEGVTEIRDASNAPVPKIAATAVGTYTFTTRLLGDFVWSDGTTGDATSKLVISKPKLTATLAIDGWQTNDTPNDPAITTVPAIAQEALSVKYQYAAAGGTIWSTSADWATTAAKMAAAGAGTYDVRAIISATENVDPPSVPPVCTVTLWAPPAVGAATGLGYRMDLTVTGYDGAALTDFPMLVRLAENAPAGFRYRHAQTDGSDIRFLDAAGRLLPCEVDTWNPDGESLVWVKVPSYANGTVVTLCWGRLADEAGAAIDIPDADSTSVWSDYVGVWHLNEEIGAAAAATATSADSTGHGLSAKAGNAGAARTVSTAGRLGLGRVASVSGSRSYLEIPNYDSHSVGSAFTWTGWYKASARTANERIVSRKNAYTDANGWEVEFASAANRLSARGSGGTSLQFAVPDFLVGWVHMTLVYDGTSFTGYANGVQVSAGTIGAATDNGRPLRVGDVANENNQYFKGAVDELRLRKGTVSADWTKADYGQMRETRHRAGTLRVVEGAVFLNRWAKDPDIGGTSWGTGLEPRPDFGLPVYGTSYFTIFSPVSGATLTNAYPTVAGGYVARFRVDAGKDGRIAWSALATAPVGVEITVHSPYSDLSGPTGDSTLNGRVLLGNDDTCAAAPVSGQSYCLTNGTERAYWTHAGDAELPGFPYLQPALKHVFRSAAPVDELCGQTEIWRLTNTRVGNLRYLSLSPDLNLNYLPQSPTALASTDPGATNTPGEAAHFVMRNARDASILSPCYTNGVGTVYFDAVNGWTKGAGDGYGLVVEVVRGVTTNADWILEAAWEKVPIRPYLLDEDVSATDFAELPETDLVELAVARGGSDRSFYRLAAQVNERGPVRFRIRRETAVESFTDDGGGFILIDNVIASYPAMRADLLPLGRYDVTKTGKQALGQENAWSVPFPAVGDAVVPRLAVEYTTNAGHAAETSDFVVKAVMHYRWRYFDQMLTPAGDWRDVYFDPANAFAASGALELPDGLPGDVEFWFESTLNAPFYKFVDYSGLSPAPDWNYSEEVASATNRIDLGALGLTSLPSDGADWFVRLREGASDYEAFDFAFVRGTADPNDTNTVVETIPMELVDNHIWRAYLPTPTNVASGPISFQVRPRNLQEPGSVGFAENEAFWHLPESEDEGMKATPASAILVAGTNTAWGTFATDTVSGYMLFQVDDRTRALTVVHADYMNFNSWTDAKGAKFKGSATTDEKKVGTSPQKRKYEQTFDTWLAMPATNRDWTAFSFRDLQHLRGLGDSRQPYVQFADSWDEKWKTGPGMWVGRYYADDTANSGVALQMKGCGEGSLYLDYTDATYAPRGLESVTFNARLGQFVNLDNFSVYAAEVPMAMSNYTFAARTAFDLESNAAFAGNASLSLVAYFREGRGCYEARWEQVGANWKKKENPALGVNGPAKRGQRLTLYRWNVDEYGEISTTRLAEWANDKFDLQGVASQAATNFLPFFVSAKTTSAGTEVIAGVRTSAASCASPASAAFGGSGWCIVSFTDTDDANRFRNGTYGVLSANSPGVFGGMLYAPSPRVNAAGTVAFDDGEFVRLSSSASLKADWTVRRGRMAVDGDFLVGSPAPQTLTVEYKELDDGSGETKLWKPLGDPIPLTSFGSPTRPYTVSLYTTKTGQVRFRTGGKFNGLRTDVVIDSVSLRQWRGLDSSDPRAGEYLPLGGVNEWTDTVGTNFVFTSAWIENAVSGTRTNGMIRLSAKRAVASHASSVRTPVLDGLDGRGAGLGSVAFDYRSAQANTRLLLQVATNKVTGATLQNYDASFSTNYWVTVATYDFADPAFTDRHPRAGGTLEHYFGLHGVPSMARLVVDPALVAAVANVTDTSLFGEILIDAARCYDEPRLDSSCWWGCNLRMVGRGDDMAEGDAGRRFLADGRLSLALNNSATADVEDPNDLGYRKNKPFVQTPTFATNVIGEISFRARTYDGKAWSPAVQPSALVLYASEDGLPDGTWTPLRTFVISNSTYSSYSYKTDPGQKSFKAFRLAVSGADGVTESKGPVLPENDPPYAGAMRVLVDEVLVSEAVRARMAFRNVGTFRSDLTGTKPVVGVPGIREQPICNEAWGVQCEVYAAQLADEVNLDRTPRVRLYWHRGTDVWGFESWKEQALRENTCSYLSEATGTTGVYRSSYTLPDGGIVDGSPRPEIVQYALEVVWYGLDSDVPVTNTLTGADWTRPAWYRPIDLNAQHGGAKGAFSAYNVLDTVAPGWAWINEMNLFGDIDFATYDNTDKDAQFVEVAAPAGVDLTGWKLVFLVQSESTGTVISNTVATFGSAGLSGEKDTYYSQSNMSFRVIGSPHARDAGALSRANGTLDGVWDFTAPGFTISGTPFMADNAIFYQTPFGIQLVRPSGIVEHELVTVGTNFWGNSLLYGDAYSPTNDVAYFNGKMPGSAFFYAGADEGGGVTSVTGSSYEGRGTSIYGTGTSLGVFRANGAASNQWSKAMACTPGSVNAGQEIDPDAIPTPNGESIVVYANLDTAYGHVEQSVDGAFTNANRILYLKRGSDRGTNIVYRVDPWYELGSVTTNGAPLAWTTNDVRTYSVNVGRGCSNNVTVLARATVERRLGDYGVADDNRYAPAVIDWLSAGVDAYGAPFANQGGDICLADFLDREGAVVTNLTLTEMYWLDIDPTRPIAPGSSVNATALQGYITGFASAPYALSADETLENRLLDVFLVLTNRVTGGHVSPYVLRGLAPGETSWQYTNTGWGWTSETFKVTGFLSGNTLLDPRDRQSWVPLRWFVFQKDGASFTDAHTATIEVWDPFSRLSPTTVGGWGWDVWIREHPGSGNPWFRWDIDERQQPFNVDILKPVNLFEKMVP